MCFLGAIFGHLFSRKLREVSNYYTATIYIGTGMYYRERNNGSTFTKEGSHEAEGTL